MKKFIADFPELVEQFHYELNGTIQPQDISYGSKKKIWWQCPSNPKHVYDMPPNIRTVTASRSSLVEVQSLCKI